MIDVIALKTQSIMKKMVLVLVRKVMFNLVLHANWVILQLVQMARF